MFSASTSTESDHVVKIISFLPRHLWNNQRNNQSSFYHNNRLRPIYRAFRAAFCQYILCLKITKQQNFANLHFLCRESNISSCVSLTRTLHPPLYFAYVATIKKPQVNMERSVLCISIDLTDWEWDTNLLIPVIYWKSRNIDRMHALSWTIE